ncbi:MAG: porin [Verrucomicrobiota bacterium]
MKNTLTTITACAAFAATAANAEIVLTDDLSLYGYIDAAYVSSNDVGNIDGDIFEFELGFSFTPEDSAWSAVSEISFRDGNTGGDDLDFETLTITYAASDELSFTVGNILSYQGFETFDATGLYQFSYQGVGGSVVYSAGYAYGASADYVTDDFAAGVWAGETDDDLSIEVLLAYTGIEGLTAKFIYADDPAYTTYNFWASYEVNALTLAAEYTTTEYDGFIGDDEVTAWMVLAYYAFGDAGITFRYTDGEYFGVDAVRYTISPSYTFSDNVLGLLEWSLDDIDGGEDDTQLAAELIFTF